MSVPQSPITTSGSPATTSSFALAESDLSHLRTDPSKFQPKAWLSACWSQMPITQEQQPNNNNNNNSSSINANISKIYLALQLQAQECTTSLDDISNQVLSRIPRAIVEIERCDTEVANLRDNLQKSSSKNETLHAVAIVAENGNNNQQQQQIPKRNEQMREQVEAATTKIKSMQLARQRLHHCKTVLFEWNNLAKKADQVEKTVESFVGGSSTQNNNSIATNTNNGTTFSSIATDIAALRKSIEIIEKVEPSVVKQAHIRVSAIETKFQKYTEADVLGTLSRALSVSTSSSIAISPAQEESLQAIITIGKMPELLEKSFATLSESRSKKFSQELTAILAVAAATASSTASTTIRKVYHAIAKHLVQDVENLLQLFFANKKNNNGNATEDQVMITTMILSNSYRSALEITDNSKFKANVAKILETKMKTDEALTCGSKVLSDLESTLSKLVPGNNSHVQQTVGDSNLTSSSSSSSSLILLASSLQVQQSQKQQIQILTCCFKEPFEDSMEKLEQLEKEFLFDAKIIGSSSTTNNNNNNNSWKDELDRFSKLSDAISASATRTGKDWSQLMPDASLRVAPLWSGALSMWTKNFLSSVKKEIPSTSSTASNNSSSEKILKLILEIADASKSLPERALNLENILKQQQAHANTKQESSILSTLADGLKNVRSIEKEIKDLFLSELMAPVTKLLQQFISVSFSNTGKSLEARSHAASSSDSDNNNNNSKMPSETIRALGSWVMELPMLLETIGADTATWTSVAIESLVENFVKDVNKNYSLNAKSKESNNKGIDLEQVKVDAEYFENVLQAVDDRLEISSKINL